MILRTLIKLSKTLKDLGYFKQDFKWTIENLKKYRSNTVFNLSALRDPENPNKPKYTIEQLAWINETDFLPLENALRELHEETNIKSKEVKNIINLRTMAETGVLDELLNARNEILQHVTNYGFDLGERTDQEILDMLKAGDDCNRLFVIDLNKGSLEKTFCQLMM